MQTHLADFIRHTLDGNEAHAILRQCVHCGLCTATCPTYQILGDELDGPRGRIYLIKQMLEGAPVTRSTQLHLDRCLTCRNCETTCPSGVQYGRLAHIGRKLVEQKVPRRWRSRLVRRLLASFLPNATLFTPAMRLVQHVRPLLPKRLRAKVPLRQHPRAWPTARHRIRMLMLTGCVQPGMMPNINVATARVLDALGIEPVVADDAGCCGAIRLHLGYHAQTLDDARRNIDAWWPHIEQGAAAVVINASGCGATIKEYGHLLRDDPAYAHKAAHVASLAQDLAELLPRYEAELACRIRRRDVHTVAYHPPCTLQHGQKITGRVERLLQALGLEVRVPSDAHLCCGSAGTYSVLQPALSYTLRNQKLERLSALEPQMIVSANVGCIAHLQSGTSTPVAHWIELVDRLLSD
ncbi:(S)-2-hydroxy-acid oxidase subunit GlcF (EC 1.1.3.15) [Mycetohabitans rhizoxinica HKI 454]|uniref:Glycolate oxidase iron-sulfur subunit n=1 Tax=Mycetohabitans rhizoxinica (strain DSM 19002 / CIP 109453 / HKI 454) TaxID=882378 RepID=E5AM74_MYCRK|nr:MULTISPECIES: glycolate oxidase subunit GlcF [Mycetohabitans]MCG1046239.1 glycolate oxidase subunit GlcF [Mycetohabitans sp. B6]CBW73951.1 (S)-2-hydroxy-acid oxidase subunit GlcF (EC 1.1.3.15) [Mycetohabitans rhizoxinica HKI 454]